MCCSIKHCWLIEIYLIYLSRVWRLVYCLVEHELIRQNLLGSSFHCNWRLFLELRILALANVLIYEIWVEGFTVVVLWAWMSLHYRSQRTFICLRFTTAVHHLHPEAGMLRVKVSWVHVMRLFSKPRSRIRNVWMSTMICVFWLRLVVCNLAHVAWFGIRLCPYTLTRLPHGFWIFVRVEKVYVLIILGEVTACILNYLLLSWQIIIDYYVTTSL